jgi:hypothetical protein
MMLLLLGLVLALVLVEYYPTAALSAAYSEEAVALHVQESSTKTPRITSLAGIAGWRYQLVLVVLKFLKISSISWCMCCTTITTTTTYAAVLGII